MEPGWDEDGPLCSDITISQNKFLSVSEDNTYGQYAVRTQNSNGDSSVADGEDIALDHNYWGSAAPDFDDLVVTPEGQDIVTEPYYKADTMRPQDLSNYVPSSGGGGGSGSSSYVVSVDSTKNGYVTVSPKSASKGTTVTITVKPDTGYELDELIVTDKNGDGLKLTKKNDTQYTFTMPASKVTVEASFVRSEEEPTTGTGFIDVSADAYYAEAVAEGITNGTGNNTFSPDAACTRAQIVTFLWRDMAE